MKKRFLLLLFSVATVAMSMSTLLMGVPARAISGSEWRAGRIIDDNIFTNKDAMSVADIQAFLNSKVGTGGYDSMPGQCDVNGTRNASPYNSSITRAAYARSIGMPDKWTCLSNYYEVPKTSPGPGVPANNYGGSAIPAGARSAAQLIWDAAQTYNISPKVLLVTIHKESAGPLTTDDWPWQSQYTYAMGAYCDDSGPNHSANCNPNYAGFSIQISESARLFRLYLNNMDQSWWEYKKPGNNTILYNPDPNCGSSNVYIETKATAALYTYTPYQPNQAALDNLYGSAPPCGAYGNRNFWRIYNDWFGPSTSLLGGVVMTNIQQPNLNPARGETVTYTYSLTNNLAAPITLDAVGVVGRAGSLTGPNRDFGWQGPITLQPNATQQFTFTTVVRDTGQIYVWPAAYYQGSYVHYNNWGALLNAHSPNLSLIGPLTSTITDPIAGQTATLSATIKNNEPQPIRLEATGIPVRYYNTYNYDSTWTGATTIQPGATQTLSGTVTFDKPGPYTAWVSSIIAGQYTTLSPILNLTTTKAAPNFQLTYIETPNPNPALGEDIMVKFKLKNNSGVTMSLDAVGVVGRYDSPYTGANRDFGWVGSGPDTNFANGEEKSYTTFVSNVSELKNFYAWVAIRYQGNYIHYNNWGFMMTPHMPNLTTSVPVTVNSGAPPIRNQQTTVTATIKNNEPHPIKFSALGIPIRYYNTYNYDAVWQGVGTIAASGQSGDTISLNGSTNFDKAGPYTLWASINIQGRYITIGDQKTVNLN